VHDGRVRIRRARRKMRPPPWERMRSGAAATTNATENPTENVALAPTNQLAPTATSKTVTRTIIGRHEHVISGYSLLKGIGDGEPIASDRFMVGGHEWVLLFYPDGKRSMSDGNAANAAAEDPYAALFVALIGEGPRPLGVVQSGTGRVVRAFHRFTLVDQNGNGRHITKGRQREQGAVKISCARQDPTARNCHGYRKFVRRSVLEQQGSGYLVDDVVIIRYEIELVVTTGGALNKNSKLLPAASVNVPSYPTIGKNLVGLLYDAKSKFDCTFEVEGEKFNAHSLILSARSSVFAAMLRTGAAMREGKEGVCKLLDIKSDVFRLLLHFVYADELPTRSNKTGDENDAQGAIDEGVRDQPVGSLALVGASDADACASEAATTTGYASDEVQLDVPMTQHLLVAADRFDLNRLRAVCEARLCESVDVETVANTLALAELNHASALKRACLFFIAANLSDVINTEGYESMSASCPHLAGEILSAVSELRRTARPSAPLQVVDAAATMPSNPHNHVSALAGAVPPAAISHARAAEAAAGVEAAAAAAAAREAAEFTQLVRPLEGAAGRDNLNSTMSAFSQFLASRAQRIVPPPGLPLGAPLDIGNDVAGAAAIAAAAAQDAVAAHATPMRPPPETTRVAAANTEAEPQTPRPVTENRDQNNPRQPPEDVQGGGSRRVRARRH